MIDITYAKTAPEKTAVALGYFDGLHLGHIGVIMRAMSRGLKTAVFTFNCDTTLPKFQSPEDIVSFENKKELLEKIGVDYLYAPDFADVCGFPPEEFVSGILIKRLNAAYACCGRNFRFGKNGAGTPELLARIGEKYGMTAETVPDVCHNGVMISSTHIRELIREGKIEEANALLGYELWYRLPVIHGNEIGRTLSFPTINQIIPSTNVLPRFGVYGSYVDVRGAIYRGVTNIGVRPTVTGGVGGAVMETYIIGFDETLYGERISVALRKFIRPERKFSSLEELKAQIEEDKKAALAR